VVGFHRIIRSSFYGNDTYLSNISKELLGCRRHFGAEAPALVKPMSKSPPFHKKKPSYSRPWQIRIAWPSDSPQQGVHQSPGKPFCPGHRRLLGDGRHPLQPKPPGQLCERFFGARDPAPVKR